MKSLEWVVAANNRAVEKCDHCRTTRESLEAHGAYLAHYEVLRADHVYVSQGDEVQLCRDCAIELVECGASLKRTVIVRSGAPWDGSDVGE